MTDRFDRLPKWAQEEITRLERRAAQAEKQCAQLSASTFDGSGSVLMHNYSIDPDVTLPDRANIRFSNCRGFIDVRLQQDGTVIVNGSGRVAISPNAANSFSVWLQR